MKNSKELIALLNLKDLGDKNFSGNSVTIGSPHVFGGQVLAQAVNAAYRTIPENRFLHSLHSYFLEAGDLTIPINYHVAEMRDGGSFSTRRVTASQNGKTIFILAASFHRKEDGFEHQEEIKPDIKQPEELFSWVVISYPDAIAKHLLKRIKEIRMRASAELPRLIGQLSHKRCPFYHRKD